MSDVKVLTDALETISRRTERKDKPCPGSHSYYSSMHPNADTTCPHCGGSEDTVGRDLVVYEPTAEAALALKALAIYRKQKP